MSAASPVIGPSRCQWNAGGAGAGAGPACPLFTVQSWISPFSSRDVFTDAHPLVQRLRQLDQRLEWYCMDHMMSHWADSPRCRVRGCEESIALRKMAGDIGIADKLLLINNDMYPLPHSYVHTRMAVCPVPRCDGRCRGKHARCDGSCIPDDVATSLYFIADRSYPLPFCFRHCGMQTDPDRPRFNIRARKFELPRPKARAFSDDDVLKAFRFDVMRPKVDSPQGICRVQGCNLPDARASLRSESAIAREIARTEVKERERTHEWFHRTYGAQERCESPFCDAAIGWCMRHEASLMPCADVMRFGPAAVRLHIWRKVDLRKTPLAAGSDERPAMCIFHHWKHPDDHPATCVVADCLLARCEASVFCNVHDANARKHCLARWKLEQAHAAPQQQQQDVPMATMPNAAEQMDDALRMRFNNGSIELQRRFARVVVALLKRSQTKGRHLMNQMHVEKAVTKATWRAIRCSPALHNELTAADKHLLTQTQLPRSLSEQIYTHIAPEESKHRVLVEGAPAAPIDGWLADEARDNFENTAVMRARARQNDVDDGTEQDSARMETAKSRISKQANNSSGCVHIPHDAFLKLLPYLKCPAASSVADVEASRNRCTGDSSDHSANPFVIFMSIALSILSQLSSEYGKGVIRTSEPVFRTHVQMPVGRSMTILPLLFDRDALRDTYDLIIAYCCLLAKGLRIGHRVTISSCYPTYDKARSRINMTMARRRKAKKKDTDDDDDDEEEEDEEEPDEKDTPVAFASFADFDEKTKENDDDNGTLMPSNVDDMLSLMERLQDPSSLARGMPSAATSVSRRITDTVFSLLYLVLVSRGTAPPTYLYARLMILHYYFSTGAAQFGKSSRHLWNITDDTSDLKATGRFIERLQLVCAFMRSTVITDTTATIGLPALLRCPMLSTSAIAASTWRWIDRLYARPELRQLYSDTQYIRYTQHEDFFGKKRKKPLAPQMLFPYSHGFADDGAALDDMWQTMRRLLHARPPADLANAFHKDATVRGSGWILKTPPTVLALFEGICRVITEPFGVSNVQLLRRYLVTGTWPVELPKQDKPVRRSYKATLALNKERKSRGEPELTILSVDDEPVNKKQTHMALVLDPSAHKSVCGFGQSIEMSEACEMALHAQKNQASEVELASLCDRAKSQFNAFKSSPRVDKLPVAMFQLVINAIHKKQRKLLEVRPAKRRKMDKSTTATKHEPIAPFAETWAGVRSINPVTAFQQKSELVGMREPNQFWTELKALTAWDSFAELAFG